jgi:FkbM family methyltransferase
MEYNLLFKRPFYFIIQLLQKILRKIEKKIEYAERKKQNKKWNSFFKDKDFFVFNLKNNIKINLYKNVYLSRRIYNGFEEEELDFIDKTLNKGDVFIDIGANIGLFTLVAARKVGVSGKVISFEPTKNIFEKLVENCEINNFNNVDLRNIGLSDKVDTLTFFASGNGLDAFNSFVENTERESNKVQIETSTLDIELEGIDKANIKIVKMDVEGWEKFVLFGGQSFFKNFTPIVMMEFTEENTFQAGYSIHDLYDIMVGYGYKWYRLNKNELVEEKKQLYYPYVNLIAIKK